MKPNKIEFEITGSYALFTDPINRMGGEKFTYQVPTYEALKGITEAIYWKPTLTWIIDKVRIMNPIRSQAKGIRPLSYGGGNTLSLYNYLYDVRYQVSAHFEWDVNREDLAVDRNENKHHNIAKRYLERGGRRDIFLGTRECPGYVEPCEYGFGKSYYDQEEYAEYPLGVMFHGFTYPNENAEQKMYARFWHPQMKNGEIVFFRPEQCEQRRELFVGKADKYCLGDNLQPIDLLDETKEFGGEQYGVVK